MDELRYQVDLLKAINQKLGSKEKMYQTVFESFDGVFIYHDFDQLDYVTLGHFSDLFGFEITNVKEIDRIFEIFDDQYVGCLKRLLFLENTGEEMAEECCLDKEKKHWYMVRSVVKYDSGLRPLRKVIGFYEVTKVQKQSEELNYFAYYDSITGLYNRNYFVRLLGDFLRRANVENEVVSVMMIDIDDFHKINDGQGMVIGDEVVQQFGCYLKEFCNDNVVACHINRDVYCIAIYGPSQKCSPDTIHKAIVKRTKESFLLSGGQDIRLTVSIGVAEYPEAAASSLELINCSEIVMLKCKALGKNNIQYFDAPILKDFLQTIEIENQLKQAVMDHSFEMYYQPQFYAGNKKIRGAEALIRWKSDNNQMINPAVFIPIAEKNGAILQIGNWVVEQSIRQYSLWKSKYNIPFVMSINISSKQFAQDDFVIYLMRMLEKYHVNPGDIELEITESILIEDFAKVSRKLQILMDNGIRISLDDFGTGYSSLSYLKRLPINTLKIDKSFIDTVLLDSATRIITESIIDMVKSLGFESIAEGVEDEQQFKYLHAIGCDVIQGYLLSKPMPANDFEKILQNIG